jgi:hypothetical protein
MMALSIDSDDMYVFLIVEARVGEDNDSFTILQTARFPDLYNLVLEANKIPGEV